MNQGDWGARLLPRQLARTQPVARMRCPFSGPPVAPSDGSSSIIGSRRDAMLRATKAIVMVALLAGLSAIAMAQPGRWVYLGDANVDGAVDHDRIRVTDSRGSFRAIQMRVEKGAIEFDRVVIHY